MNHQLPIMRPHDNHHPRGSIYLIVMAITAIVAVIGIAAMMAVRLAGQRAERTGDYTAARMAARSAIALGANWIQSDTDWRNDHAAAGWGNTFVLDDGAFTVAYPGDDDPVVLKSVGSQGRAAYQLQAQLEVQSAPPLDCLQSAMQAGEDIRISDATLSSDQTISANGDITVNNATVSARCRAVGGISGVGDNITETGVPASTMPDASSVFNYYISHGVTLALPPSGVYQNLTMGPTAGNPDGIQIIDAGGQDITIKNCRITGTVVILDPGSNSIIEGAVNWQPAVSGYPALLVRGDITIDTTSAALSESTLATDFNGDGDLYDAYPSLIRGLIYCSGRLTLTGSPTFQSVILAGGRIEIEKDSNGVSADVRVYYNAAPFSAPPPGFTGAAVVNPIAGAWRHVPIDP